MGGTASDDTYTLREIQASVDQTRQAVKLFNFRGPASQRKRLAAFFENQDVRLEERRTPTDRPKNFLVLQQDDAFLAADSVEKVDAALVAESGVANPDSLESMPYPTLLERVDQSVFQSYDKLTMIGISRGVEQFAWRAAEGEIHAGFQRLSLFYDQTDIYRALVDRGVEVHVYGAPDDTIDYDGIHTHGYENDEIRQSWFVVFDRPEGERRGLLAWERVPDDFRGFWTTDDRPIDAILDRLRTTYPATH